MLPNADWSAWIIAQVQSPSLVLALVGMMIIDVVTGLIASAGAWSSKVSYRGMMRKVSILAVVGAAALIESVTAAYLPDAWQNNVLPISRMTALFFLVTETLSVLENAQRSGVPIPNFLTQLLANSRDRLDPKPDPTTPVPPPPKPNDPTF